MPGPTYLAANYGGSDPAAGTALSIPGQYSGFTSYHTGGANFLLGDGTVRFISENVNSAANSNTGAINTAVPGVYQNLATINDGNVLGAF